MCLHIYTMDEEKISVVNLPNGGRRAHPDSPTEYPSVFLSADSPAYHNASYRNRGLIGLNSQLFLHFSQVLILELSI